MSSDWKKFGDNQQRIYREIAAKRTGVLMHGVRPDIHYQNHRGAFSIALLHSPHVAEQLSSVSQAIAACAPAVVYRPADIHTTLYSTGTQSPFLYDPHEIEHQAILNSLVQLVQEVRASLPTRGFFLCYVGYAGYLLTQEVVIARGDPDWIFSEIVEVLSAGCKKAGIVGTPAWGAHATISRFTAEKTAGELGALLAPPESSDIILRSFCTKIAVGYSLWGPSPECPHPTEVHGHFVPYRTFAIV